MASMTSPPNEVTRMLVAWGNGDEAARDQLMPLVYDELHRLAKQYMNRERPGHTLQTSALVNEAFLRLAKSGPLFRHCRSNDAAHSG